MIINEDEWIVEEEIACPWCGYRDPDSWECESDYVEDWECPKCGKEFIVSRIVDIQYATHRPIKKANLKKEDDNNQ